MKKFVTSFAGIVCLVGLICLIVIPTISYSFAAAETTTRKIDINLVMQVSISAIMIIAGLYIILSKKYEPDTIKWAFAIIGLVVGYWLPASPN